MLKPRIARNSSVFDKFCAVYAKLAPLCASVRIHTKFSIHFSFSQITVCMTCYRLKTTPCCRYTWFLYTSRSDRAKPTLMTERWRHTRDHVYRWLQRHPRIRLWTRQPDCSGGELHGKCWKRPSSLIWVYLVRTQQLLVDLEIFKRFVP